MPQPSNIQALLAALTPDKRAAFDATTRATDEAIRLRETGGDAESQTAAQGAATSAQEAFLAMLDPNERKLHDRSVGDAQHMFAQSQKKSNLDLLKVIAMFAAAAAPAALGVGQGGAQPMLSAGTDGAVAGSEVAASTLANPFTEGVTQISTSAVPTGAQATAGAAGGAGLWQGIKNVAAHPIVAAGNAVSGIVSAYDKYVDPIVDSPLVSNPLSAALLAGGAATLVDKATAGPGPIDPQIAIDANAAQIAEQNRLAQELAAAQAAKAQADEEARQGRITQGESAIADAFNTFTPDYYGGMRDSYIGAQMPYLQEQYGDAKKQVTFGLARGGNLESSVAADAFKKLFSRSAQTEQQIRSEAESRAQGAKAGTEQARQELLAQNKQAADPGAASSGAAARAATLRTPAPITPISNVFTDLLSDLVRTGSQGIMLGRQGYPGFRGGASGGGGGNSVRVVA